MRTPFRKSHGKITFVLYNEPHPCGGSCLYCFSAKGFTKSTTPNEDTTLAKENGWSGSGQMEKRFALYGLERGTGIKCDLAVKGDSFASHEADYLRQYTKELYDFLNGRPSASLEEAAAAQADAPDRCVTYKVETRPDQIDKQMCRLFMELGVTTVELGVQSLDNRVLACNKRGHGVDAVIEATRLLRKYGFEVCYQVMVGLPGSTPDIDGEMLTSTLWRDPYAPDALKVYPCLLLDRKVASQERLRDLYRTGQWKPLDRESYIKLLQDSYPHIPSYVHINRIQRIIPAEKIEAGPATEIDRKLFDPISRCLWQRSPAQRMQELDTSLTEYRIDSCTQGPGRFCFEACHRSDTVLGYGRLDLIGSGAALIRDLRTLGNMLGVGTANPHKKGCQHVGIGSSLLRSMEEMVRQRGDNLIFVKPSFGTVRWFTDRGYTQANPYLYVKRLNPVADGCIASSIKRIME